MNITIPELSLVILIGPSGSGRSTFAHKHFKSTEILSSDFCRGLVSDDENDQSATKDAFEVLHFVAAKRLAAGKLTVIDATNVQSEARKPLLTLAREYHCLPVAIVFNLPEKVCQERNHHRPLMPWSVKAQALLLQQYASVGSAARAATGDAVAGLELAAEQGRDVEELLATYRNKQKLVTQYVNAYRRYCWPVYAVTDLKLAPFHLLATQGKVYTNKDHAWHMETLAEICRADEALLLATPFKVVDITGAASIEEGIAWWRELTGRGGEGMVVKPLDFLVRGKRGIVQPALKCRGPEYLRIIYGPEYSIPQNLEQLRKRGLGAKRSLALREFSLGVEALERFVRGEPLRRVHECVFGVLALESEPVDPRL